MQSMNVVVLQSDASIARSVLNSLERHFSFIYLAPTLEDAKSAIARYRAQVVVLDMEVAPRSYVERLRNEFPSLGLVCTHRLADEEMWTAMVGAGATDLCYSSHNQ